VNKRKRREEQSKGRSILHQRQAQRDMENVPTFMRNERYLERQQHSKQQPKEEKIKQQVVEKTKLPIKQRPNLSQSTRQEELKRLFKRIKKKPISEETVEEVEAVQVTTDFLHPSEAIKPSATEEIARSTEQVTVPLEQEKATGEDGVTLDMVTEMMSDFNE